MQFYGVKILALSFIFIILFSLFVGTINIFKIKKPIKDSLRSASISFLVLSISVFVSSLLFMKNNMTLQRGSSYYILHPLPTFIIGFLLFIVIVNTYLIIDVKVNMDKLSKDSLTYEAYEEIDKNLIYFVMADIIALFLFIFMIIYAYNTKKNIHLNKGHSFLAALIDDDYRR